MAAERAAFEAAVNVDEKEFHKTKKEELFYADSMGFFPFALAIVLGIILAKVVIPLPGGAGVLVRYFRRSAVSRSHTGTFG